MLDFEVHELTETFREDPEAKFIAKLNIRSVAAVGRTEHEAIVELMRYIADLGARGCLKEEEYLPTTAAGA